MTDAIDTQTTAGRREWVPPVIVGVVVTAVAVIGSQLIGLNLGYTAALLLLLGGGTYLLHRWRSRRRADPSGADPPGGGPSGADPSGAGARAGVGTVLAETAVVAAVLFVVIQVLPFGRMPSNPPVTGEPAWNTPETRALAVRACYDCHSNETAKPWYSNIAPVSWAVSDHVESGRGKLNFSEFDKPQDDADKAADITEDGEMPPDYYTRFGLHSTGDLSDEEVARLVEGLRATPGLSDD